MDTAESAVAGRSEVLEMGTAHRPLVDVLVATCPLVAAVLIRWLLDPLMGDTFPLVTLFGAVAAAVCMGGYPALLVVALGYPASAYLFIEPRHSFISSEPRNLIGLALYLVTCSIIIGIGESLRASERRFARRAQGSDSWCGWQPRAADRAERGHHGAQGSREALRHNEKRYRALVSILADVPWQADPAGHLIAPQSEQNQFTGTTEEQNSGEAGRIASIPMTASASKRCGDTRSKPAPTTKVAGGSGTRLRRVTITTLAAPSPCARCSSR